MKYLSSKHSFFLLMLLTLSSSAWAQYSSDGGTFEVNARETCVGGTIEITDPCTNCADYDFDNDGDGDGTSFQYNSPGNYRIEAYAASGISDFIDVSVYADTIPQFDVYRCSGRSVELLLRDNNYDSYRIDWGDGSQNNISGSDTQELHTYATAGNKTVMVQGLYDLGLLSGNGNCSPGMHTVNVVDNIPTAEITSIYPLNNQNNRVVIKYTAPEDALYRLQLAINNSSNWIPSQMISAEDDSIIIDVGSLDDNYYCFRIATLDACQTGNPPVAFSQALCTQDLDVSFTRNEENVLTWRTSSTSGTGITIEIEEEGSLQSSPSFPIDRRNYTHEEVICNTEYCYTLVTNYPGGATVRSIGKCGFARLETTPPAITDMATQVDDNEVWLNWSEPTESVAEFYNLSRATNNMQQESIAREVSGNEYTDTGINASANRYCYLINYEDRCDNVSSMSRSFCLLRLTGNVSLQRINLSWNAYDGYSDGVSDYLVEKFTASGVLLATFNTSQRQLTDSLELGEPQEIHYRVTAIPNDGDLENSVSNIFIAIRQHKISAPNAFIPGSGGENSTFKIVAPFVSEMLLQIFNRWGEMVFTTTDIDSGWPGTDQNGNPLPQGTYIFKAKITSENGEKREAAGTILLLRR